MAARVRRLFVLLLIVAIVPGVLVRDGPRQTNNLQQLSLTPLPLPPQADRAALLGPFTMEGAWRLSSPNSHFGGYSTLTALGEGQMRAFSDRGYVIDFAEPGSSGPVRLAPIFADRVLHAENSDAEAAVRDPVSGKQWVAWEGRNAISRLSRDFTLETMVAPPAMKDWPSNTGPEAMTRLHDGRFIVLSEAYDRGFGGRLHSGLLFDDEPAKASKPTAFTFTGPKGFHPVDMAVLPDGRVLVLMRQLQWPMPPRFGGRIVVADPAEIMPGGQWQARELARLEPQLDNDNFEGMAIEPSPDGTLTIWLISDNNDAVTQQTLLWKLRLDPVRLTAEKQKARRPATRPWQ